MYKLSLCLFFSFFTFSLFGQTQDYGVTPKLRAVTQKELYKPHVGFAAGVGNPEGSLNAGGNYTLNVGYQPYVPVSVAGEYSISNYKEEDGLKLVRNSLLLKVAYNYGGNIPFVRYSYIGLGVGPMWEDTSTTDELALGFLPNIGFDYPLNNIMDSPLSLGVNVGYLYSTSDNPDVLNFSGVLKYWY